MPASYKRAFQNISQELYARRHSIMLVLEERSPGRTDKTGDMSVSASGLFQVLDQD